MGRGAFTLLVSILTSLPIPGDTCKGRTVLTESSGIITDGETSDYPSYARCEWLIDAKVANKTIYLEFDELNTECSYDFLFIYDGNSYTAPMLASFSGNNLPDPIMARSGQMLVYLFSDRNYERRGFKARYQIQDCPMNCSGQGNCIDHRCYCFPGRSGVSCAVVECPNDCGNHGKCVTDGNTSSSVCECDKGYSGYLCNISLNDSVGSEYWYEIAPSGSGLEARSAHAGAFLKQVNCLYIFGGFTLNEIIKDLKRFCFDKNKWEGVGISEPWPGSRYEHAVVEFESGFYMFGGILENGSYSNELWYFNVSSENWTICAQESRVKPKSLSGHTLTRVENELYLFGGKTSDGQFWADIYKIDGYNPEQWQEVVPLGGKLALRRLVGHSTVYHEESKSLLIYGGYSHSRDQPRFGSHTNNLHVFHVENRIWSQITFADNEMSSVPSQRSFHSAVIMGNYMVIYGGNTHIHHDLELCYDFDMYLYHLGCHTWTNTQHLLGKYSEERKTLKRQGRVNHVAAAAYGNILLVAGGYSGYVRGDLIAFKFPPIIAPPENELSLDLDYCRNYTRGDKCWLNPDCLYCNNISTTNTSGCLHRTQRELCSNIVTPLQYDDCPGICGRLGTCLECLSQGQGATLTATSLQRRTYIQPCNWCVKEAKCQLRAKPSGNCLNARSTVTGVIGWWGGASASLSQIDQCRLEDYPAGLHAIKYRPTVDWTQPDEVIMIRESEESEKFRHIYVRKNSFDEVKWIGFIHPLNATIKINPESTTYALRLVIENISVTLKLNKNSSSTVKEPVMVLTENDADNKPVSKEIQLRPDGSLLFANRSRGNKYYIEVTGGHKYPDYSEKMTLGQQMYSIQLKWNGRGDEDKPELKLYHPFHFEFLEPYNNGSCGIHTNCMSCMTDTLCGWCDPANVCVLRNTSVDGCVGEGAVKIMITEPSTCPTCADHVECHSCASDPRCEWVKDYVYCVRRGRAEEDRVVRQQSECPLSCHQRLTCSSCLNISECAWCENLRTCLPFSDYVSRHRHGQCTEWIDSEVANSNNPYTCRNCSSLKTCDQCLKTFSCGWCGNRVNPTIGVCYEGDFAGPYGNQSCSELIAMAYRNTSRSSLTELYSSRKSSDLQVVGSTGYPVNSAPHLTSSTGYPSMSEPQFAASIGHPNMSEPQFAASTGYPNMTGPQIATSTGYPNMTGPQIAASTGYPNMSGHEPVAPLSNEATSGSRPVVSTADRSTGQSEAADWSYSTCPDVEECLLKMARCHPDATCINTPTAYNCTCNRGFTGNGIDTCLKTCFYKCAQGVCLEEHGEFFCDCDLGWTGPDCATDCKCNGHSMCENGTGKCDYCLNGTTGPYCDQCLTGHYGDPTKSEGCFPCQCNKHGNESRGLCHNLTGDCFCVDNTEGFECQRCQKGYYGDPRNGGKCYMNCNHGLVVENITKGSLGSHSGPGVSTWRAYCLWILTVSSNINNPWSLENPAPITFVMDDLAVECERDYVYVYDGIPEFIDSKGSGILLGAFCGFSTGELEQVVARSGILTIYFDADIEGEYSSTVGFNGSYFVNQCGKKCETSTGHEYCDGNDCVCQGGYDSYPDTTAAALCSRKVCMLECSYQQESDSCLCEADYGADKYQINMYPWNANAVPTHFGKKGPVSRYGHTLIYCNDSMMYLFGGRSLEYGLLNDIWQFDLESHEWTEIKTNNVKPSPRYFHAGECVPNTKTLYIFGGLVDSPFEFVEHCVESKEMWRFLIDAKTWTRPNQEPDWVDPIAGHTMTRGEGYKLYIIGGFSSTGYFNDRVYIFDTNSFIPAWEYRSVEKITGAKPTGIYGHSAVYKRKYNTIYIFGGHLYKDDQLTVSDQLFTFDVADYSWNVLQPDVRLDQMEKDTIYRIRSPDVEKRYFHTAIGFEDYMLVVGGFTDLKKTSPYVLVYKYKCNFWMKLNFSNNPLGSTLTSLIAASAINYRNSMYIFGGVDGVTNSALYQIKLPDDLCSLNSTREACIQPGCSFAIVTDANIVAGNKTYTWCYSNEKKTLWKGVNVTVHTGPTCDEMWHRQRGCLGATGCSQCVATYPAFKSLEPTCFWCENCMTRMCVTGGYMISGKNTTPQAAILRSSCPVLPCDASTCKKCNELNCLWSQNFKREYSFSADIVNRQINTNKHFEWSCLPRGYAKSLPEYDGECPEACKIHRTCDACLESNGGEGGSLECYWSETLKECFPPAFLSMHCLGGTCGTVLQGKADRCPAPCSYQKKCADCRRAQGCGWCAYGGENGKGACMPGTRSGPAEEGKCEKMSIEKITDVDILERDPHWAYTKCPPEDECRNGHHNCDLDTQNCNDELSGFSCTCKNGYINRTEENGELKCTPVCHQGCEHGNCVRPEECVCHFGYIGRNCSTKCECNGHSNCESVDKKDRCLECMNNTQGQHCEQCKPLYVGDPKNGGKCISCPDFCHEHSDICMYGTDYILKNQTIKNLLSRYPDTRSAGFITEFAKIQKSGPELRNNTLCLDCKDNTQDKRCEKCQEGYFRLPSMSPNEPCIKCMCNGHSDICDRDSGLNCKCQNNTDSTCNNNNDNNKQVQCHKSQCAHCKEYFIGTPTDGHHCYRVMTVNRDYCFDPVTQAECTRNPGPLHRGRTVFFVVSPKYVNVDIRVTVDVTVGGIDVFFSPSDDTFKVTLDEGTGVHNVHLDQDSLSRRSRRSADHTYQVDLDPDLNVHNVLLDEEDLHQRQNIKRSSDEYVDYHIKEVKAQNINTFLTVNNPKSVLIIRNLQGRLVITLPNDKHNLKTSRFYMVFFATGDLTKNETMGNLYFRQDQPHIDLFVFFSVFFSCFFLFLAMCVLLWKTKQGFDARRTRQQRAREMLHMASRPFAKVLVLIDHAVTPVNISPLLHTRSRKPTDRTPLLLGETNVTFSPIVVRDNLNIVPITIEPTDDGVAAVGTLVFQLPGGVNAPSQLCLGSTLTNQLSFSGMCAGKIRRPPASTC